MCRWRGIHNKLANGDTVEIVTLVGGGSNNSPADKPLVALLRDFL